MINGFGLQSANDCPHRDPVDIKVYGKVVKKEAVEEKKQEAEGANGQTEQTPLEGLVKGYTLIKEVNDNHF